MPNPILRSHARKPRWRDWALLRRGQVPPVLRDWLLDRGSLTRHVVQDCSGAFRVQVQRQVWGHPLPSEQRLLGLRHGTLALVREVELRCAERPWVFAKTLIPATTLRGGRRRLARLGDRPLGAVLFADPQVRRERVEIAMLLPRHILFRQATARGTPTPPVLWARRTLFLMAGWPLLVNEVFLPEILLR